MGTRTATARWTAAACSGAGEAPADGHYYVLRMQQVGQPRRPAAAWCRFASVPAASRGEARWAMHSPSPSIQRCNPLLPCCAQVSDKEVGPRPEQWSVQYCGHNLSARVLGLEPGRLYATAVVPWAAQPSGMQELPGSPVVTFETLQLSADELADELARSSAKPEQPRLSPKQMRAHEKAARRQQRRQQKEQEKQQRRQRRRQEEEEEEEQQEEQQEEEEEEQQQEEQQEEQQQYQQTRQQQQAAAAAAAASSRP